MALSSENQEFVDELRGVIVGSSKAGKGVKSLTDLVLGLGGASKYTISNINKEISAWDRLGKKMGDTNLAEMGATNALSKLQSVYQRIGRELPLLASVTMKGAAIRDKQGHFTGKYEQVQVSGMKARINDMVGGLANPRLVSAFKAIGIDAAKIGNAAGGLTSGVAVIGGGALLLEAIFKAIGGGLRDSAKNAQFLISSGAHIRSFSDAMSQGVNMFIRTRANALLYGQTQEDVLTAQNKMANSLMWNSKLMDTFGADTMTGAVSDYLVLAKGAGMGAEQAGELGNILMQTGTHITNLGGGFMRFYNQSTKLGINMQYMEKILGAIAPVSLTSADAAKEMYGTLGTFREAWKESTNVVTRFLWDSGKTKQFGDAMVSWSEAAAKASNNVGELLAFGSGMPNAGAKPWTALTKALEQSKTPGELLMKEMQFAMKQQGGGEEGQKFGAFAYLQSKGVSDTRQAFVLADAVSRYSKLVEEAKTDSSKQGEATKELLKFSALSTQALGNPMDRLVVLVQQLVGIALTASRILGHSPSLYHGGATAPK